MPSVLDITTIYRNETWVYGNKSNPPDTDENELDKDELSVTAGIIAKRVPRFSEVTSGRGIDEMKGDGFRKR